MKRILALDLGTKTGYCYGDTIDTVDVGTKVLAKSSEVTRWGRERLTRRCDPRVGRFAEFLGRFDPEIVLFEDVEFSKYTQQTQLWASFRSVVWLVYGRTEVLLECVPVGTLKKFATGAGNAGKSGMQTAAKMLGIDVNSLDDNAIDALHLWRWGERNLSRWQRNRTTTDH